jgi:spoIIIJ-associated protein
MKKNNRRIIPPPRRIEIEMDYSEKWGKDVDEAVKLALNDLKVSRDDVDVIVLEEPVRGFLGIGAKLAKVRVEKKKEQNVQEKSGLRGDGDGEGEREKAPEREHVVRPAAAEGQKATTAGDEESPAEAEQGFGRPAKNKVRDLRKKKPENVAEKDRPHARDDGSRDSGRRDRGDTQKTQERRRDGGRTEGRRSEGKRNEGRGESERGGRYDSRRDGRPEPRSGIRDNKQAVDGRLRREKPERHDYDGDQEQVPLLGEAALKSVVSERPQNLRPVADGNEADKFFRKLMEKMLLEVTVNSFENEDCVYLEVQGKDSRMVIGKRGQTLDAIQYLTNLVANKNQENYIRVIVDVEGYRSRRERTLEHLAAKLARKVEKTGRGMRLEPMNPYERKVIHSALQSNPRISTRSEGEEPYRRVIIEKK